MAHDQEKSLTIEPGEWSAEADHLIGLTVQHATPADIRHQVQHGGARLFYIRHEGATCGAFVLRVDETPTGAEGVIVAAAAHLPGVDMIGACMPAIESLFIGCKSIRYHTAIPALARKLSRIGYVPREIVCFKETPKNELLAA
jgi:hypothetical protein